MRHTERQNRLIIPILCNFFKGNILPDTFFERISLIYLYQMEKKYKRKLKWRIVHRILSKMVWECGCYVPIELCWIFEQSRVYLDWRSIQKRRLQCWLLQLINKKTVWKNTWKKIKDIKLRVPEEYLEPIKEHAKKKGMSINQLVISLLEKDMGIEIVTIREQNKQSKDSDEE